MAARFARLELRGILDRPELAKEVLNRQAKDMALELADFGAERMREYVKQRGTAFSAAAQAAGVNRGPGRIRTGNMYDSIDSRAEGGKVKTLAAFGWIKNFQQYFMYQETGFRNRFLATYDSRGRLVTRNNEPIVRMNPFGGYKNTPGMFALRDARADVESKLPSLAKKYRTRITKEINGK
jgi:hypothetical protein